MSEQELPEVLTLVEAAAYLRISEKTLRDLVHRRDGDPERPPCRRTGLQWRFSRRYLDLWLAGRDEDWSTLPLGGGH